MYDNLVSCYSLPFNIPKINLNLDKLDKDILNVL